MPPSLSHVDPELFGLLDRLPELELSAARLAQARVSRLPLPPLAGEEAGLDGESAMISAPGPAGAPAVPLTIYRPKDAKGPLACIFHIHRGGYVIGSSAEDAPMLGALASQLGCMIASVDYRLAPETRFPGPIEDCWAALTWLYREAAVLGIDARRIGLMGEGAGGGLAAALALFARDMGERRLAFQYLTYPMLDDRTCLRENLGPLTGGLVWTMDNNRFGWSAMLDCEPGSDGVSHYAAPARAMVLEGLPPTYVSTAEFDLFLDENLDYARRLSEAGVPVELHVWPGAFHGFDLDPTAKVAVAARRTGRAWLKRMLLGQSSSRP